MVHQKKKLASSKAYLQWHLIGVQISSNKILSSVLTGPKISFSSSVFDGRDLKDLILDNEITQTGVRSKFYQSDHLAHLNILRSELQCIRNYSALEADQEPFPNQVGPITDQIECIIFFLFFVVFTERCWLCQRATIKQRLIRDWSKIFRLWSESRGPADSKWKSSLEDFIKSIIVRSKLFDQRAFPAQLSLIENESKRKLD